MLASSHHAEKLARCQCFLAGSEDEWFDWEMDYGSQVLGAYTRLNLGSIFAGT